MAKGIHKLNDIQVKKAVGPCRLLDGGGLLLTVDSSGAKRWSYRYTRQGKAKELGLGGYPAITLAAARRARDEAKTLLASGGDPIAARRQQETEAAPVVRFGPFAEDTIAQIVTGFKNEKHKWQWLHSLKQHAASLWDKPIADIGVDDVLGVLTPLWGEKQETASRIRGRLERPLDAARVKGLRPEGSNPAAWRGNLAHLLPKRRKLQRGHHPAIPVDEIPAFIAALRKRSGVAARGLEFLALTATRSGEVREAAWDEFDLRAKLWCVPAARTKTGKPHRVPLTPRCLEILEEMAAIKRGPIVFPSYTATRPLSSAAFESVLNRMAVQAVPHGMRSSFRDWAFDRSEHPREIVEAALAHSIGAVEAAYRRSDALERRRVLMTDWGAYLNSTPARLAANDSAAKADSEAAA